MISAEVAFWLKKWDLEKRKNKQKNYFFVYIFSSVEFLSLIVTNPMNHSRNKFLEANVSHHCEEDATIPCKATLIIMPSTLIFQWKTELKKHAPSLKVKEYNGIQVTQRYFKCLYLVYSKL
jgi:hypothetical protein